jgi:AraC-like DNA-binding protein
MMSAGTAWVGLPIELHSVSCAEYEEPSGPLDGEQGLLIVVEGSLEIVVRKGGTEVVRHAGAGYVSFLSGNERRPVVRMSGDAKLAAVHLPKEWFSRLALDAALDTFGLTRPLSGDEVVPKILSAMFDEIARGVPSGRLFAESLSTALLSYVLRHVAPSEVSRRGALSDAQCRRLRSLIHERLGDDLRLDDLARAVGLCSRHFTRLFRRAFGTTPHQYVLGQRLSEATRLLERGQHGLADVALQSGFANQSHFTAAFRKAYGMTPGRYAASKRALAIRTH